MWDCFLADLYFFSKYKNNIIAVIFSLVITIGVISYTLVDEISIWDINDRKKYIGNTLTICIFVLTFVILYILGVLYKSRLFQYQFFLVRKREKIFVALYICLLFVGGISYIFTSTIYLAIECLVFRNYIDLGSFLVLCEFALYQMTGYLRLLLICMILYLSLEKIMVSIFSAFLGETVLLLLLLVILWFVRGTRFTNLFLICISCFIGSTMGYSVLFTDYFSPFVLSVVVCIEAVIFWKMGMFVIQRKQYR